MQLKPHKSIEKIAKKHRVDISVIRDQLKLGSKLEHEHTKDMEIAVDIALQHLDEIPDYYTRLIKMEKQAKKSMSEDKDPCWKNYTQVGMKTKGGRKVPNCVPAKGVPKASGYKKVSEQVRPIETQQGKFDRMVGSASLLSPKTKIIMLQQAAKNHPSKVKSVDENHIAISKGKELDDEGAMIKSELETIERAIKLMRSIVKKDNTQVPAWVQSKVTKAADYIDTAADYMAGNDEESVDESFKVIQSSGQLYHIIVNFMSKNYSIKIYFPMQNRPSQQDVNDAVQKIYPGGKTLAYYPCVMSSNSNYLVAKENISFDIPKGSGALGKRSGEQLLRLKDSGLNNNQLNRELEIRGIKPRGVELPLASRGKGGSPYEPYTGPEKKGPYVPAPQKPSKMQLAHNQIEGDLVESDNHALAARSVEIETEMRKRSKNYLINIGMIGEDKSPAWQRKAGKNPEGGLNDEGIRSYRAQHPGSKLQKAVTTKPSKLKKGSTAAKRRNSFCDRMSGMKEKLTSAKTARDPNSRINKSLRKWNC